MTCDPADSREDKVWERAPLVIAIGFAAVFGVALWDRYGNGNPDATVGVLMSAAGAGLWLWVWRWLKGSTS